MCSVRRKDDCGPLPSQLSDPDQANVGAAHVKNRIDAALWTEASQGSELTQRLPVKVAPASTLTHTAARPNPAHLESIAFLKRVVQHPYQYYTDHESTYAKLQPPSTASEAGTPASSLGDFSIDDDNEIVDSAQSDGSQRTQSHASSDKELPAENEESETVAKHPSQRHSCNYCDYRTRWKPALVQHVRTHTGSKPFRCEECGYRAAQKGSMALHVRIHTGEKPYRGEHCDFRTGSLSSLNVHKRTHTGVKPYACQYGSCGYRATTKQNMRIHFRTHTGEKPHECPLCAFRSAQKSSLAAHLRTHTGEKPYKCSQCAYRSTQSGNLNSHVRRMH